MAGCVRSAQSIHHQTRNPTTLDVMSVCKGFCRGPLKTLLRVLLVQGGRLCLALGDATHGVPVQGLSTYELTFEPRHESYVMRTARFVAETLQTKLQKWFLKRPLQEHPCASYVMLMENPSKPRQKGALDASGSKSPSRQLKDQKSARSSFLSSMLSMPMSLGARD